jgi:UDP-glucose 4-epimerase
MQSAPLTSNHATPHNLKNSVCLITGGAGFIGSHLASKLLDHGVSHVKIIDSFKCGDPLNLSFLYEATDEAEKFNQAFSSKKSLAGFSFEGKRVSLYVCELGVATQGGLENRALENMMQGVDYVFHLAAEKHNQSKDSPYQYIQANISGTQSLLEACVASACKKVIFTSSLYAYGRLNGEPFVETEVPRPQTVYGMSKLAGEHLLHHFAVYHGLQSNSIRFLFVYGPRQFAGMGYKSVIVKNFERIIAGEQPIIFGDGLQSLDYVYVDDACDGLIAALERPVTDEVFNIGSGIKTDIKGLTSTMLKVSNSTAKPIFADKDWTHNSCRVGVVEKARKILDWHPKVSLEEGLKNTFEWMESHGRTEERNLCA